MTFSIDLTRKPWENCPSFQVCSTNACPLHPDYHVTLFDLPDRLIQGWKKCKVSKATRIKIAGAYKLKSQGLTGKEADGIRKSIVLKKEIKSQREKSKDGPQVSSTELDSEVKPND